MFKFCLVFGFICLGVISLNASAHDGASGIIKERMDRFTLSKSQLKQIKAALITKNFKIVANSAADLRDWARIIPNYFPEGSGMPPSEASPRIWEEFDSFIATAKNHEIAAINLMNAAKAGQEAEAIDAFKALAGTCSACHRKFRK